MIYELIIEEGKDKPVINFLKQLDFVTVKAIKKSRKKASLASGSNIDLPYFGACPDWETNVTELRKHTTEKRLTQW